MKIESAEDMRLAILEIANRLSYRLRKEKDTSRHPDVMDHHYATIATEITTKSVKNVKDCQRIINLLIDNAADDDSRTAMLALEFMAFLERTQVERELKKRGFDSIFRYCAGCGADHTELHPREGSS
ncbi:MAG: hypothetical protein Q8O94_02955 [bacterium]|nr:hypothetical protein [bacterium]